MSNSVSTQNRFFKGAIATIILISYAYYLHWAGDIANNWFGFSNLVFGYLIAGAIPAIVGLIFYLLGFYSISFRIVNKSKIRNTISQAEKLPITNENIDSYGIIQPILEYKNDLEEVLKTIKEKHFTIDDTILVSLYIHGLAKVQRSFCTTTYLTSGFWTHGRTDVITANTSMLDRLTQVKGKSVRRIFLLRKSKEDEIKSLGHQVTELKNQGQKGETRIAELSAELESLKKICITFQERECKIKFYHDSTDHSSIGITKNKTEIAIYDDFRIDYFDGGDNSQITGIKIFHEKHKLFASRKEELTNYFEQLWTKAENIDGLFDEMENAIRYHSEKIDYSFERLLRFEYDLNENDKAIKFQELNTVLKYLEKIRFARTGKQYLDVGTCTGRYPFAISKSFPGSYILGIDADPDCVQFCNIQKEKNSTTMETKNLLFRKLDFLYHNDLTNEKFDLITCMLGTISHFGWNKNSEFKDDLQRAIIKAHSLLKNMGFVIISNWTEFALNSKILTIYDDLDRKRLRKFTEKPDDLKKRLQPYFTILVETRTDDNNLDILLCQKK